MALKLLQPGGQPLGQFDCLDADLASVTGGEVMTFGVAVIATDKAAADVADGYVYPGTSRTVVKLASGTLQPFMLADDGTSGYGTLFGTVVGGTVGKVVTGGAVLGPSTQTGSGKITCWDKPGLYAVTLGSADTTAVTGLVPTTNTTLVPGAKLYVMAGGLLTPNASASGVTNTVWAGRFVSFETDRTLVNTPNRLVSALNSPSGSAAVAQTYTVAVFQFNPSN